jgi:hypothetical protein
MITVLAILFITLMAAAFTIFALRYALSGENRKSVLPPPNARGLFSGPASEDYAADSTIEKPINASNQRAELIKRARQGDLLALSDAHATGNAGLYSETLDALVEQASGRQDAMSALVNHIAKSNELRANTDLAERVLANWKTAPDRRSTIEILHIAALSDDAATYQPKIYSRLLKANIGFLPRKRG